MTKHVLPITCEQAFWIGIAVLSIIAFIGHYNVQGVEYFFTDGGIYAIMALIGTTGVVIGLILRTITWCADNLSCRCNKK